jgi:7-cyano-7-deazaguanine reductase
MSTPELSPLGKSASYPTDYAPEVLFPMPRATQRALIGVGEQPVFMGADLWTAYELSWLNPRGKPQVALARLVVPADSPNIVESKSLKLYLGSFANARLAGPEEVVARIRADLSTALWQGSGRTGTAGVQLVQPEVFAREGVQELEGLNLDRLDLECTHYQPAPELLTAQFDEPPVTETLASQLLKSNCLVTGQPDWGSVQIRYSGPQIDQAGLLQYLVSFRNHNEFHEHCVERIFMDIWRQCRPSQLMVYARYTRRGGLDINPFRTSHPQNLPPSVRTARQ